MAWKLKTLGVSSAWDLHEIHPGNNITKGQVKLLTAPGRLKPVPKE